MKKPDSLRIVLSVRLRTEETEERALAAACAEVFRAETAVRAVQEELTVAAAECLGDDGGLLHGVDFQAREMHFRWLRQAFDATRAALAEKTALRATRQAVYLEARRGREVMDTLLKQRALAEVMERQRRETSRAEDLFLSRRSHEG